MSDGIYEEILKILRIILEGVIKGKILLNDLAPWLPRFVAGALLVTLTIRLARKEKSSRWLHSPSRTKTRISFLTIETERDQSAPLTPIENRGAATTEESTL